jgi:hypothetical protein
MPQPSGSGIAVPGKVVGADVGFSTAGTTGSGEAGAGDVFPGETTSSGVCAGIPASLLTGVLLLVLIKVAAGNVAEGLATKFSEAATGLIDKAIRPAKVKPVLKARVWAKRTERMTNIHCSLVLNGMDNF